MSIPDPICAPDLLSFAETDKKWSDLSDDDKRAAVVAALEQTVNFGVANSPEGRHEAYGDIIAPGEATSMREALLQKTTANSSCGLLIRSIWRFLGAKDHLLDPPYKPGLAITNLIKYAQANGAHKTPKPDDFDPHVGDVLLIQQGNHQHIFTITEIEDDGVTFHSIDGGQISKVVDDGGCNGIQRRVRKLNKETLTFEGDARKITDWIDVTQLPFSEPIVELTKGMSDDDVK
jgi:hypothetical protein